MEIRSTIRLTNNLYQAEIALGENGLTPVEVEVLSQFGQPSIDCGGEFGTTGTTGATGTNTYFTLPANAKLFPANFPVKESFSLLDFPVGATSPPNAAQRADVWRDEIVSRITTGVQEKRAESVSTDIGTIVQNIDTTPV
jgi:hypothetical protein